MSASFLEDNVVLGLSPAAGSADRAVSASRFVSHRQTCGGTHHIMRCVCGWGATFALPMAAAAPQSCRSPHLTPLPSSGRKHWRSRPTTLEEINCICGNMARVTLVLCEEDSDAGAARRACRVVARRCRSGSGHSSVISGDLELVSFKSLCPMMVAAHYIDNP
jgi:hypothetical protein